MYRLSVMGRTPEELRENIVALAASYGTETVSSDYKIGIDVPTADDNDDEMEEVESPYKGTAASLSNVMGGNVDIDADGLPWDARIHSSNKKKTTKGVWVTRRGVDDAVYYQVRTELLAQKSVAPVAVATPSIPNNTQAAPVQPVQQLAPAPTPAPVMPQVQGGHTLQTFSANFPMIVATLVTDGKITQDYVNQWKNYFEVAEIWMITDEQKAVVFEQFVSHGFVTKVG